MDKVANETLTYEMVSSMAKKLKDDESNRMKKSLLKHFNIEYKEEDFEYLVLIIPKSRIEESNFQEFLEKYDWMFADDNCEIPVVVNTNIKNYKF
jgi:hypothetical protein